MQKDGDSCDQGYPSPLQACDRRGNLEHMGAIPVDTDIEKLDWKRRVTKHRYTFLLFWEVLKNVFDILKLEDIVSGHKVGDACAIKYSRQEQISRLSTGL